MVFGFDVKAKTFLYTQVAYFLANLFLYLLLVFSFSHYFADLPGMNCMDILCKSESQNWWQETGEVFVFHLGIRFL